MRFLVILLYWEKDGNMATEISYLSYLTKIRFYNFEYCVQWWLWLREKKNIFSFFQTFFVDLVYEMKYLFKASQAIRF